MSWILSDKSPFHKNCKIHILSNPEYEFWNDMVDHDDGYIGIRIDINHTMSHTMNKYCQ